MMKKLGLAFVAIGALTALPVWGHHSFAAEFDEKKPLKLTGTVTKMEWVNPHVWIHIEVPLADKRRVAAAVLDVASSLRERRA